MFELSFIWAGLIAFAVLAYVVLDGFDLGVGILFPFVRGDGNRDLMMNSVAPVWDGNETWLILGGGGLFAAFPVAYAIVMPALYIPIIVMLLGLIFRGVAFEYRWRTQRGKWLWDVSFAGGSIVATFAQGVTLGALIHGIEIEGRAYAGERFEWLTPFAFVTGLALLIGYALLGATWLVMKTEGHVARVARRYAWYAGWGTLGLIGLVSLWTPFVDPFYFQRWFSFPTVLFSVLVPGLTVLLGWRLFRTLDRGYDHQPFFVAQGIFLLAFCGIGVSFYPYIVPPSLTIEAAAAPRSSQVFMLVGAGILIPIILAYTAYAYWVFRGKVDPDAGYH